MHFLSGTLPVERMLGDWNQEVNDLVSGGGIFDRFSELVQSQREDRGGHVLEISSRFVSLSML